MAQGFTTGGNGAGYVLDNVELNFGTAPEDLVVRLVKDSPGGSEIDRLINPTVANSGNLTFTATQATRLNANTTYFLAITGVKGTVSATDSDAEDSGGASGWSVENGARVLGASRVGQPDRKP